jgi:hypothetical protein
MKPIRILLAIMNEVYDVYQSLYLHASTVPWTVYYKFISSKCDTAETTKKKMENVWK